MSTSHPNFASVFEAALESYRRKTKKDLALHPLLHSIPRCDSADDILSVLRDQINQSQDSDDEVLNWVIPTVKVLSAFSDAIGPVLVAAFPSVNIVFAGISVLLSAVKDASACQDKLIDVFNRIEPFFRRIFIYTSITPTTAMMETVVEIMVEVINILAIATKDVKSGRLKRYLKKLAGNSDMDDSLKKLDKLTEEEARMAHAEMLKVTHSVDKKVTDVDKTVNGVDEIVKRIEGEVLSTHSYLRDVGGRVKGIEGSVQVIQEANDNLRQVNQNDIRERLSRWLSAPDSSVNHINARNAHHDGTAQWFLKGGIYNQWKSSGSLLWIHGKPGSGKTVLSSSIIDDIEALHGAGTAFMAKFYFDFRDIDKQNLHNLLSSLLKQFSARSDTCCDTLSGLYSKYQNGEMNPSDRIECLKAMLHLGAQAPTYIIIDALDECPITSTLPSPREEVLKFVEELVGLHLPNLRICVTSRPEYDIRVVLEHLTKHSVSLHDENGQREDIAEYVHNFVHSNERMKRWREEDKNHVVKTLSKRADNMFRWVTCQLGVLQHCFPPSIRCILDDLPDSLDETYGRILREIKKPNQGHAHRLLQCLVAAVRPLTVKELAEVLAFDFDAEGIPKLILDWRWENEEEEIMSVCSNLVTIVNDRNSRIVQFSHFSVKEFLTAERLRVAKPFRDVSHYHIRLETAHMVLARACLGVLLRLDDGIDQDGIKNFPLAHYAGHYWPSHARFQAVSSHIKDGLKCLFDIEKPHFATWLWIFKDASYHWEPMCTTRPEKPIAAPLYFAASWGFRDLAEHLISKHPEQIFDKGASAVHIAATEGHADILSLLLEHGADVDGRDFGDMSPLHQAAWFGEVNAGKLLLDHGANVDVRCNDGFTPLFSATHHEDVEFARMLLEHGAEVNVRGKSSSDTPLHWAASDGRIETVRLLLDNGADANAGNIVGQIPSHMAGGPRWKEIVELLSKYGAKHVKNRPLA